MSDPASRRSLRSRSLWDRVLSVDPADGTARFATVRGGPAGQSLLALSLVARFPAAGGERRFQVIVAQDRSILDAATRRFGRELAVALLILGAVLGLAAVLQVQLGLAPLRKLRQDVETIRRGTAAAVAGASGLAWSCQRVLPCGPVRTLP